MADIHVEQLVEGRVGQRSRANLIEKPRRSRDQAAKRGIFVLRRHSDGSYPAQPRSSAVPTMYAKVMRLGEAIVLSRIPVGDQPQQVGTTLVHGQQRQIGNIGARWPGDDMVSDPVKVRV